MGIVKNPILSGFYPDPSVCAVDTVTEDGSKKRVYYLVNSTFCYTPGVPIFYSEDLCEWTQIGHVLTKETQLNFDGLAMSKGIYAPTIRYHKGTFYMITTNVMGGGNFYVTATDPAGEWSEPVYLPDAEGIDPSLFFDGDTCYYVG
ncbi:MAG: family 43 glycosylhydrolase, partial [Eubacterium sp.]|nr:family 43 glycosylhydrolase [Eubacterium sp.]